jgi:hypothetical protein
MSTPESRMTDTPDDKDPFEVAASAGTEEDDGVLLSPEEIANAIAEARKRYSATAKKKARDALIAEEMNRIARVEGMRTGDGAKDEEVPITIDLPEYAPCLVVNMEPFWHGHTYVRPRHMVNSLREMINRAWSHQDDIDGKSISQRLSRRRMADSARWMSKSAAADPRFTFSAGQVQGEA